MIRSLLCLFVLFTAGSASAVDFASNFAKTPDRVWAGAAYWANPMEDWAVQDGRLECLGGGNRNVVLLTRSVTGKGAFEVSVRLG